MFVMPVNKGLMLSLSGGIHMRLGDGSSVECAFHATEEPSPCRYIAILSTS
jgi:hypothetical protein